MAASPEQVMEVIREVARGELELARGVDPTDALQADLQLDSMGLTVLAVALEDRFRIKLSEDDSAQVVTAGDLARLVSERTQAATA